MDGISSNAHVLGLKRQLIAERENILMRGFENQMVNQLEDSLSLAKIPRSFTLSPNMPRASEGSAKRSIL